MNKTYVLDTSALINDPVVWENFPNSNILIPIACLNELDNLKKQASEAGRHARVCIKNIDQISDFGDISVGVLLDNNVLIKVDALDYDLSKAEFAGFGNPTYGDTQILACLYSNWLNDDNRNVCLISNDINLRVKAKARGIEAQCSPEKNKSLNDLYAGVQVIVDEEAGLDLQQQGHINPQCYGLKDLNPHECVLFESASGDGIAMGRKVSSDKLKLIKKYFPWGLSGRNKEQTFALDLVMDKNIDLVTLVGRAGTGKTLIALAASLELVLNKREYDKLVIYRPTVAVDDGIGWLPGPQPLDAKILTPTGWTTMGELTVGSEVISRDGKPTKIINIYPKGKKSVYKITTTEGTFTECCEDHLWLTQTSEDRKRSKSGSIKTTKEIAKSLKKNNKINHFLPRNEAIHFNEIKLPLPPYVLGTLLGDGSISNSIAVTNLDKELIERCNRELVDNNCYTTNNGKTIIYNIRANLFNNKPAKPVKITNILTKDYSIFDSIGIAKQHIKINQSTLHSRCQNKLTINGIKYEFLENNKRWQNPVKQVLHELGLSNSKAWNKFIPNIYKFNSIENRIALLQGIMDTDGTIKKNGEASFCTTSKQLADDVIELVRSLGGRAIIHSRNRMGKETFIKGRKVTSKRISYEFTVSLPQNINPFYISEKAKFHKCNYIHKIGIDSIEYVGEKEVQCIMIENAEHLYITDNFIVTHNTLEEKMAPWMQPIMDNLETLLSSKNGVDWKRELEMFQRKGRVEMSAISYIRGRSIPNSIILIDEAQNISASQIKTILTRAGENTKIILTGDLDQIDNNILDATNNGLTYAIEKFKKYDIAGHITLTQGERSRLASLASEIL